MTAFAQPLRQFWAWLRPILLPLPLLIIAATSMLGATFLVLFFNRFIPAADLLEGERALIGEKGIQNPVGAVAIIWLVLHVLYRVWGFHPALHPHYRDWLALTPWTPEKALPLGPVHFVFQDGAFWLAMTAVHQIVIGRFIGAELAAAGSVAHVIALVVVLFESQTFLPAYGILLLLLIATVKGTPLWAVLVWIGLAFILAQYGLRRSLRTFSSWAPLRSLQWSTRNGKTAERTQIIIDCFPWNALSPHPKPVGLEWREAVAIPILLTVAFYAACTYALESRSWLLGQSIIFGLAAAGIRVGIYVAGHWPPLSLLGRLATGRFIIPGYDRVFAAPLVALLLAIFGPQFFMQLGLATLPACTLSVLAQLLALTCLGPDLQTWRLTGQHRIAEFGNSSLAQRL